LNESTYINYRKSGKGEEKQMNAQEAIEQLEKFVRALKEGPEPVEFAKQGSNIPDTIELTERGIEAMEIVLFSAKIFHGYLENVEPELLDQFGTLKYTEPFFLIPEQQRLIGLEKEVS